MCGIAGIIYRDGTHPVGAEMTRMLQSMKHRGPDSTGYALYGTPENGSLVMRYKLADANTPRDFGFAERLRLHRREVETRLARLGAQRARGRGGDAVRVSGLVRLRRRPEAARRPRRGHPRGRGALARSLARDRQGPRRRRDRRRPVRSRLVHGHACDRPRPDGDRVRGGHRGRAPVLGLSVLGRRGRAQRPADELLHVAPAPRALRPPVHVRVRLRDHRRLPRREDGRGRHARGGDAPLARRARRRVHVHRRHDGRARRRQGRARREAARPLRVGRPDRGRLRGDRDPPDRRPRDRDVRPLRARSAGLEAYERHLLRRARARRAGCGGARHRDDRRRGRRDVRREGPDDPPDQPRASPADLRGGRDGRRRAESRGAALARGRDPRPLPDHVRGQPRLLRLRPDRRSGDPHQGPRRLVRLREHDERGRRGRLQRRLAHRRCDARRRPRRQGPRRRAHRDRPEGRHDHRLRRRRLDERLHDAARPPDHPRQRRPRPRRLDVRRDDLRRRHGEVARDRLRARRVDGRRHGVHRAEVPDLRPRLAARAPEVRLRQGALQLRLARALGKEAGDL